MTSKKLLITGGAGHARWRIFNMGKLENELNWKADENFDSGIVKTVE